jgi:hypothetical protein
MKTATLITTATATFLAPVGFFVALILNTNQELAPMYGVFLAVSSVILAKFIDYVLEN